MSNLKSEAIESTVKLSLLKIMLNSKNRAVENQTFKFVKAKEERRLLKRTKLFPGEESEFAMIKEDVGSRFGAID